jgi:hypothetical protein
VRDVTVRLLFGGSYSQSIDACDADRASAWSRHSQKPLRHERSKSMHISIALPIAAALVAAIGLSSPTPAQAKSKPIASCNSDYKACVRNCAPYTDYVFQRGCLARCDVGFKQSCGGGGTQSKRGTAKPGVLSVSTAGQPAPKGPVLGVPTGTNGGGKPVVKPISRR